MKIKLQKTLESKGNIQKNDTINSGFCNYLGDWKHNQNQKQGVVVLFLRKMECRIDGKN